MPSIARLPGNSRRASRYASGTPTTKPMTVVMSAAVTVRTSERRTSSWRRASPSRPAPAPTIMLAAGRATKVTSTTPATAQSAQNGEMRRPRIRAGEAGARGAQGLPGACTP